MNERYLAVDDVAERLGLSPQRVRALIAGDRLPALRVGGRYVLDASSVAAFSERPRLPGRPLNASSAWALLAELSGGEGAELTSRRTGYRLRKLLDAGGKRLLRALVHAAPRSQRHVWRVLPADLDRLRGDPRVVLTGLAADDPSIDVRYQPAVDGVDGYVSDSQRRALERELLPEKTSREPNLVLRVPAGSSWILAELRAPAVVVAADLLDHPDERVRRSARRTVERAARDRDS
jgi:excisionase family DNA binding protein